jgi:hypothetical protein
MVVLTAMPSPIPRVDRPPTLVLATSSFQLRRAPDHHGDQRMTRARRLKMRMITRTLAGLAIGAVGALAAVGAYAETHRAPDQP